MLVNQFEFVAHDNLPQRNSLHLIEYLMQTLCFQDVVHSILGYLDLNNMF